MSVRYFSPKLLCFLPRAPRRLCIFVAHLSSSSSSPSVPPNQQHSFSSYSSSRRHHEEESRNVRVSVWWDFENCNLPAGVNVFKVAHTINTAVRASGIKGPVTITAVGDVLQLSRVNQEALSSTGINIIHVPHGGKNSADRSLLMNLMFWVAQNPPPAHLFLISGDRDFATLLHRLRMNNYNILLATLESAPSVLSSAASIMWDWHSLIRGECLSGKYFNQPPDGPYGSWYGHYKAPLEDPFVSEEWSEPNSDSKLRPLPKVIIKQIRNVLSSYPKGVSIDELRAELAKRGIMLDKDFYGHKKFSRFLLSMPNFLEIQRRDDGHLIIRGVSSKVHDSVDSVSHKVIDSSQKSGDQQPSAASKVNGDSLSTTSAVGDKSKSSPCQETSKTEFSENVQPNAPVNDKNGKSDSLRLQKNETEPTAGQDIKVIGEQAGKDKASSKIRNDSEKQPNIIAQNGSNTISEQATKDLVHHKTEHKDPHGGGFLAKIRGLWYGSDATSLQMSPDSKSLSSTLLAHGPESESVKDGTERQKAKSPLLSSSLSSVDSAQDVKISAKGGKSESENVPGLFGRILNWFRNRGEKAGTVKFHDERGGTRWSLDSFSRMTFSKDSFWSEMKSFLNSARGSALVSQSTTREEMAQNLLKEGPFSLKSLSSADALALVNMLISDKKWIKELPSGTSPFRVTLCVENGSDVSNCHATNGLRSIFMSAHLHSGDQGRTEHHQKKPLNVTDTGVVITTMDKKPFERARSEIVSDCRKLVNQILKEHPEGYNMGSFRRDFLEKYGYHLEIQKLGYRKLQHLLQIFPEVRIESCYIVPSTTAADDQGLNSHLDTELYGQCARNDDPDGQFEELGPVSSLCRQNEPQLGTAIEFEVLPKKDLPAYEPSLSDDEISDSEGESPMHQNEKKDKQDDVNNDSSLLQILDLWYKSKNADDNIEKSEGGTVDSSLDDVRPPPESRMRNKTEIPGGTYGRKQRPTRTYTFVSESGNDNKEKLIDGILGSLKKSSESGMES